MGLCFSLCNRDDQRPNPESRFPILEIRAQPDSDSDPALKTKSTTSSKADAAPLLDGPTLLKFHQMQLSDDLSPDEERDRITKLLQPTEVDEEVPLALKPETDSSSRTFPNVPADYNADGESSDDVNEAK
jgi:hypothetical protein